MKKHPITIRKEERMKKEMKDSKMEKSKYEPKTKKESKVKAAENKYEAVKKTTKPGTGKRFDALQESIEAKGKSPKEASAIAASAGIKKYGKGKMNYMSKKGMESKSK